MLYSPLHTFLKLASLSFGQFLTVCVTAAAAVLWYELVKLWKHLKSRRAAVTP